MRQIKRILLIDDDLDHLLACNLLLRRSGYGVLTMAGCDKIDELFETVETFRPNLIFLEHDMRGICGMDLIRVLKSHSIYRTIPVVYFSGRDDIVELARKAGADNYIRKPLDVRSLMETAQKYLMQE